MVGHLTECHILHGNIAKEADTETDCWRPLFKVIMMYFTHTHAGIGKKYFIEAEKKVYFKGCLRDSSK